MAPDQRHVRDTALDSAAAKQCAIFPVSCNSVSISGQNVARYVHIGKCDLPRGLNRSNFSAFFQEQIVAAAIKIRPGTLW